MLCFICKVENDKESVIMRGMLDRMTDHIREAVIGADHFTADHAIIVTWYKQTFTGASCSVSINYDECYVS